MSPIQMDMIYTRRLLLATRALLGQRTLRGYLDEKIRTIDALLGDIEQVFPRN